MEVLVEFKKRLKEMQTFRRNDIKRHRSEYLKLKDLSEKLYVTPSAPDLSYEELEREFPHYYSWFPNFKELVKCYEKHDTTVIKVCLLHEMVKNVIAELQREIQNFQMVIDACDNDKVKFPIKNFDYLLMSLIDAEMSIEDSFMIFGMFCACCSKRLKVDSSYMKNSYVDSIFILGDRHFNANGFLKENLELSDMWWMVDHLNKIKTSNSLDDSMNLKVAKLLQDFLSVANKQISRKNVSVQEQPKELELTFVISETFKEDVPRDYLDELKRYYKSGELIAVPEDLLTFTKLLDKCEIDEKEKRYVLGLVNEVSENRNSAKILKHLNTSDQKTYQKAEELLKGMHHTNGDYYTLIQLLEDLRAAGEMLEEVNNEEEKEELLIEVEILLSGLRGVISKYNAEEQSKNNILFLLNENEVPYVKEDSDNIDGSFYKMVCSGIRKIRKENQGNFRLVMTSDNMPYRTYDILSSKVHISFIEIDNGVYVVVGVDSYGQGYEEIVRRVINNEGEIRRLETLVKDENSRNSVLVSHEAYLSLFNPDAPNTSRKRISE